MNGRHRQPVIPPGRFDRQLTVPGFGAVPQQRLRSATVLIAGVGGVGGATATYLAAAGVGRLVLVHPGDVDSADLNRQTLIRADQVGQSRVACAARTLREHYPDVEVEPYDVEVTAPAVGGWVTGADAVVDARHNFGDRYHLNRDCVAAGVPLVVAAMNATEAVLLVVRPGGPCLRCVFAEADPRWEPLGFPVLGAVAGTVGTLAAMEVIKILGQFGATPPATLLHADLWDLSFTTLRARPDPACPDCAAGRPRRTRELELA